MGQSERLHSSWSLRRREIVSEDLPETRRTMNLWLTRARFATVDVDRRRKREYDISSALATVENILYRLCYGDYHAINFSSKSATQKWHTEQTGRGRPKDASVSGSSAVMSWDRVASRRCTQ